MDWRGNKTKYLFVFSLLVLNLSGCGSILFVKDTSVRTTRRPTYMETTDFFFFGLVGSNDVYLGETCREKEIDRIETEYRTQDILLTVITLGIYSPRAVKVWCSI